MKVVFFFSISLFLLFFLCLIIFFTSFSSYGSYEDKGSSFECGFQSFTSSGSSFSIPFFIISLMFLIFDVEILLVCFYPLSVGFSYFSLFYVWCVVLVIFLATLYEWGKGVLSWM